MQLQMLTGDAYCRTGESDPIRFYSFPVLGRLYRNRVARCASMLPPGRRVLEIGYGSGVSFLNLGRKFEEIFGIDLHDKAGQVERSFAGTGLRLNLRQGNILHLPYEDESVDAALAISIHEHLAMAEQLAAFAEVHRVLRPGGCYVVGVPGLNAMMTAAFYLLGVRIHDHHLSSEGQVLGVMRAVFDVDVTHYSPFRWPKSLTTYLCIRGWKRGKRDFEVSP